MIILTPIANATEDVCKGVNDFADSRPPASPAFIGISWFFFIFPVALWSVSIIVFWVWRKAQRLHVVRPFVLNAVLAVSHILFFVAAALNLAIPSLPCGILVFSLLLGVAGFGINIFCRLLVYVVESKYAMKTENYTLHLTADSSSDEESVGGRDASSTILRRANKLASVISVFKVALGFSSIDDVGMEELSTVKKMYTIITMSFVIPALIPAIFFVGFTAPYTHCEGCPIFLDLVLLCASAVFYYFMCIRILYVAWKLNFPDAYGLFKELIGISVFVAFPSLIAAILLILDPMGAEFNRIFAFEWIADFFMLGFWWFSAGHQFLQIYRDSKKYRHSIGTNSVEPGSIDGASFIKVITNNKSIRNSFEKYCTQQYASENLYFVLDVDAYKRFYLEKASTWRRAKARMLYDTYIREQAVMEVNVSQNTRDKAVKDFLELIKDTDPKEELACIFDDAVSTITHDILRDIWYRFEKDRRAGSLDIV